MHYLRERLGLTGTNVGCDTSNCGACTVLLDGRSAKRCTVLAVQAGGGTVETIQGLAEYPAAGIEGWHPLQRAFSEQHGLPGGYCTPGMIMGT